MVGTVLTHISNVFNHTLLLNKLNAYGVHGVELAWFTDYLKERKQRVVMDGVSDWNQVSKGVPQGSNLGHLLFVVFVNDLPSVVRKCSVLYAGDTTIIYASNENPSLMGKHLEKYIPRSCCYMDQH